MEKAEEVNEEVSLYRQTIKKTNSILLDKQDTGYNENLSKLAKGGKIKMRVNADAMLDQVSDSLYPSPKSGLRELMFNEFRACITAKKLGAKPKVQIIFNPKKDVRSLEIVGYDSMGFSTKEFDQSFCETGASTNLDESVSGKYGQGRLASVKISPICRYDVYSRVSKEMYSFSLQDAKEMTILDQPEMKSFGTRVKLTIKEELDIVELVNHAEKLARFSQVETELVLLEPLKSDYGKVVRGAGTYPIGSYTKEKYFQKLLTERDLKSDKFFTIPIHIENDIIEFDALAIYHRNSFFGEGEHIGANEVTVANAPIESKIELPYFGVSVLNLKIERTPTRCEKCKAKTKHTGRIDDEGQGIFKCSKNCGCTTGEENPDIPIRITSNREQIEQVTDEYITQMLRSELIKKFKDLEITSLEEYYSNPLSHILTDTNIIKLARIDHDEDEYGNEEFDEDEDGSAMLNRRNAIGRKTRAFMRFISCYGVTVDKGQKAQKTTLSNIARCSDTFFLPKLSKIWEDRLHALHEDVRVFTIHKEASEEEKELLTKGLKKFGIRDGKEYAKENKIRAIKTSKEQGEVKVHKAKIENVNHRERGRTRKESIGYELEDITEDVIIVDNNKLQKTIKLVSMLQTNYGVTKKIEGTEGTLVTELIQKAVYDEPEEVFVATEDDEHGQGLVTFEAIVELHRKLNYGVVLIDYPDADKLNPVDAMDYEITNTIVAIGDPDKLFRLGCVLVDNDIPVRVPRREDGESYELDDEWSIGFTRNNKLKEFPKSITMLSRSWKEEPEHIVTPEQGWILIQLNSLLNKYSNNYPILEIIHEQVGDRKGRYQIETISDGLDILLKDGITTGEFNDVLQEYGLRSKKLLSEYDLKIKDKATTDEQRITLRTHQSAIEDIKDAIYSVQNSSIEELSGQPRIDGMIERFIQPKLPKHITLTGVYEAEYTKYILTLTDLTKSIRLPSETVELMERKTEGYGKKLCHLKLINNKDSIVLEATIGQEPEEVEEEDEDDDE
jgi:hypothetical protein